MLSFWIWEEKMPGNVGGGQKGGPLRPGQQPGILACAAGRREPGSGKNTDVGISVAPTLAQGRQGLLLCARLHRFCDFLWNSASLTWNGQRPQPPKGFRPDHRFFRF